MGLDSRARRTAAVRGHVSDASQPTIAGRPVQLDAQGRLLPWPLAEDTGYSYASYFQSQWTILADQLHRTRFPYFHCCFDFDRTTFEAVPELHWVNSTGYLRAMMEGFVERLYPYTGDPAARWRHARGVRRLRAGERADAEGILPGRRFRIPQPIPGAKRYTGWSQHGEDYIEPHVVGEDGYGYVRLYEMSGSTKYLQAAIRCADALVKLTISRVPQRSRRGRTGFMRATAARGPATCAATRPTWWSR